MSRPVMFRYATTKHAVVGLTLSLRTEAAMGGVRVSLLCPGVIEKPLIDSEDPDDLPPIPRRANAREQSVRSAGKPHAPDRLAQDALRGRDANRAIIVSPMTAQVGWRLFRLSPSLVMRRSSHIVRSLAAQAMEKV